MAGNLPGAATFERVAAVNRKPQFTSETLAFMCESRFVLRPRDAALKTTQLEHDYWECWKTLEKKFRPDQG